MIFFVDLMSNRRKGDLVNFLKYYWVDRELILNKFVSVGIKGFFFFIIGLCKGNGNFYVFELLFLFLLVEGFLSL